MAVVQNTWMEGPPIGEGLERSKGGVSNETSRLQSHKTPHKRSLANYMDSIRESLKKISGCQDVEEADVAKPIRHIQDHQSRSGPKYPLQEKTYGPTKKSKIKTKHTEIQQCGFDEYHSYIPKLDSMNRTLSWVCHSELETESMISLGGLPMRGTLLPTRFTTEDYPYGSDDGTSVTLSISSCESARGTHGRGTPPVLDAKAPRLDELFQQLQQKQEREAWRRIIASGEQHLLSFNLMDVYSHQVAGMPIGTTPEILPFMAARPTHRKVHKNSERHAIIVSQPQNIPLYLCKWLSCSHQFTSPGELFSHVDQYHIQAYRTTHSIMGGSTSGGKYRMTCKWNNCSQTYYARYKLLLHVHNHHCKELPNETVRHYSLKEHCL